MLIRNGAPGSAICRGIERSVANEYVLRVQDKEGRGPWRPGFSHTWVEDRDDHDNLLPWTLEFGRVDLQSFYGMAIGCGCLTLEQLRRWFTPSEYQTLQRYGYHAVRMEVGRILAASEIQCVFERVKPLHCDVEPVELYAPNDKLRAGKGQL